MGGRGYLTGDCRLPEAATPETLKGDRQQEEGAELPPHSSGIQSLLLQSSCSPRAAPASEAGIGGMEGLTPLGLAPATQPSHHSALGSRST